MENIETEIEKEYNFGDEDEEVTMYASFTNWEPKIMTPFLKYIETIDSDKPNILKNLIDQCLVRKKVKSVE